MEKEKKERTLEDVQKELRKAWGMKGKPKIIDKGYELKPPKKEEKKKK